MQIHDFFDDPTSWEYQPEWGSPLTFSSFKLLESNEEFVATFEISFAFRNEDVVAQLQILPKDPSENWQAKLRINETYQTWQDPHSYLIGTHTTDLSEWVAWIFSVDAESRRDRDLQEYENSQQWGGDSIEGMLNRVDLGISSYGRLSTNSANFSSASQMAQWLNEKSPNPHVEFQVYALTDPQGYSALLWQNRHYIIHRGSNETTKPKILYSVARAEPTVSNAHGMAAVSQGWVMSSAISVAMDGAQIAAHECLDVLELEHFRPFISENKTANWYLLQVKGIETAILCPAEKACIDLDWDHDGSSLSITVTDEDRVVVDNLATAKHRKHWSKWYSPNTVLQETELAAGIRAAETAFFELMAAEDTIDAKDNEND